jgi:Mrp family chromosome partitioning ATPase
MTKRETSPHDRGTCQSCGETGCSAATRKADETEQQFAERQRLQSRLCRIRHKVIVLSGKGGVGKSTVAVNLAVALNMSGRRVGLLDGDLHGPSVPTMLGLEGKTVQGTLEGIVPVDLEGIKVVSMGFFLPNQDEAVIWRGP